MATAISGWLIAKGQQRLTRIRPLINGRISFACRFAYGDDSVDDMDEEEVALTKVTQAQSKDKEAAADSKAAAGKPSKSAVKTDVFSLEDDDVEEGKTE